jgi:D-sedoheptulose 7-phosphate isomerase
MTFSEDFLDQTAQIAKAIDGAALERMAEILHKTREGGGRLFILGSGGGAGHASHATGDFRKLCNLEAYCPSDNTTELTARINDDGWASAYANWLKGSRLGPADALLVFSVGGGSQQEGISINLVEALRLAKKRGAHILGVVGRDGGFTAQVAHAFVCIPTVEDALITPHTEGFQAVLWHLLVSHPLLKEENMKWES